MQSKLKGKTFLISTNSLYSLLENDKILIFENGKTIEYGVYSDLLRNPHSHIQKFFGFDISPYKSKEFLEEQKLILRRQRV